MENSEKEQETREMTNNTTEPTKTPPPPAKSSEGADGFASEAAPEAAGLSERRALASLLNRLSLSTSDRPSEQRRTHAFWNTQPVAQLEDELPPVAGPLKEQSLEQVRRTPLPLPAQFNWVQVNITDNAQLTEVYELLRDNYVEDDDNMFRFEYSREFLKWAMCPPGYRADWHVGVRTDAGRLVAFISAVRLQMVVHEQTAEMAEVNFLCVHKKLRAKRLAPVLIKEITRRVNLREVWQAVYTAGTLLTKPVAVCSYWHRPIDIEKLVDVRFTALKPKMTMAMAKHYNRIPETFTVSGIRVARKADMPRLQELLEAELRNTRKLYPRYPVDELKHMLTPRAGVVWTFVREETAGGLVTDFFSFYALPSTVVGHPTHATVNAAYVFYCATTTLSSEELLTQCLVAARDANFDVLNTLDLGGLGDVVEKLKFGKGDGCLRYYLYNYACPPIEPREIGLVML